MPAARPFFDRFWEKVTFEPNTGCWLWTAATDRDGYGHISNGGRLVLAHRAAWEMGHGPIPDDLLVCHRCDQPGCVNYETHMFLGTDAVNCADKYSKGRAVNLIGEAHGRAVLTVGDVLKIRASTATSTALAAAFGIGTSQVKRIRRREQWQHV